MQSIMKGTSQPLGTGRPTCLCELVVFLLLQGCPAGNAEPRAVNGVLDLKEWSFADRGSVALTGEWELHWQQLLSPEEFAAQPPVPTTWIDLPRSWQGLDVNDTELDAFGFATFRLVILQHEATPLALWFHSPVSSHRLWANGELVSALGQVGPSKETSVPVTALRFVELDDPGGEIEIVVQVSNFATADGGLASPIHMGERGAMLTEHRTTVATKSFLFVALLVMGTYHLLLYALRRQDPSPLYFGLFGILWGANGVFELLPWPLHVVTLMNLVSWYLSQPCMIRFLESFFPEETIPRLGYTISAICILSSLFVAVTPTTIATLSVTPLVFVSMAAMLYSVSILIRATVRKRAGALTMLVPGALLGASACNDMLLFEGLIESLYLVPLTTFVMVMSYSYVLAQRLSRAFADLEEQRAITEETVGQMLRYQLNPHFLFNAFASVRAAVASKPAIAEEMLTNLAAFCRLTLSHGREQHHTIADEFAAVRQYLAIESPNWGDELVTEVVAAPDVERILIPTFLLQPLVENALKHGGKTAPDKLSVVVAARRSPTNSAIELSVSNTGSWVNDQTKKSGASGIGLANLTQRLERHYPKRHELERKEDDGNVCVTITIQCDEAALR